jgi:hypothetical protein
MPIGPAMPSLRTAPTSVAFLPGSMALSFMPGIQAGNPLKSLVTRQTRSIGALMTVLTKTFGIIPSFIRAVFPRCFA